MKPINPARSVCAPSPMDGRSSLPASKPCSKPANLFPEPVNGFRATNKLCLFHRGQQVVEVDAGEAGSGIAHGVGDDEFALMQYCAASVNDIGDVAFTFPFVWR